MLGCSLSAWKGDWSEALKAAAGLGFSAVDLIAIPGWKQLDADAIAEDVSGWAGRIGTALGAAGLRAQAINAAVGPPHDQAQGAILRHRISALVDLARRLDVPVISVYPGYLHDPALRREQAALAVPVLCEWAAIAAEAGVTMAVEVHWRTPWALPSEAEELAARDLFLVLDPSHCLAAGEPLASWRPLLSRVCHVHLRDAASDRLQMPWGSGDLELADLIRMLHDGGYAGSYAAEILPQEGISPEAELRALAAAWARIHG